jgi:hypothetical protein
LGIQGGSSLAADGIGDFWQGSWAAGALIDQTAFPWLGLFQMAEIWDFEQPLCWSPQTRSLPDAQHVAGLLSHFRIRVAQQGLRQADRLLGLSKGLLGQGLPEPQLARLRVAALGLFHLFQNPTVLSPLKAGLNPGQMLGQAQVFGRDQLRIHR